ncbi:secreted protein [gamma proteobacterium NOR5-3]|nr:secreted protein [gamma proteobacterium NOR5-3]
MDCWINTINVLNTDETRRLGRMPPCRLKSQSFSLSCAMILHSTKNQQPGVSDSMKSYPCSAARRTTLLALLLATTGLCLSAISFAQVPIVKPGAPGQATQTLTADEAVAIAESSYSPADVAFMQDMIPHHHQATQMAALVKDRTNNPALVDLADRINGTQADEIAFMQDWLAQRGENVPDPTNHQSMHMHHDMAGMATSDQMAALADMQGTDFDRMFLTLMIRHHDGAITMVEDLMDQPGSAYDAVLFEFTNDITNDQAVEIERMNGMLVGLSEDPRSGLNPGVFDAEQAIANLELVASLRKPAGFFDPANPAERGARALDEEDAQSDERDELTASNREERSTTIEEDADSLRHPMLSFANTDMAFRDDVLVAGNYHGFNVYQLQDDGVPDLMASIVCPGGQGDVSIVGNLLFMSAQENRGRLDCGLEGVTEDVSKERFRGLRIFDITNLTMPLQVGAVQTCRGSHTHSVVSGPDKDGIITIYNSGTSSVREEEELEGCIGEVAGDERTALFRIDVIEVPVDNPAAARIVDSPRVFADPESGVAAGLWRGGDHGEGTQDTSPTDQCHDITVFPEANIAAGACSGNGIIFDISDPAKPTRTDVVSDEGFAYWHSATFNNDGTKVLFTDEWGGGARARCRAWDPLTWGADAIYDIVDGKLEFGGYFKMPAPQLESENCVAHNGSIIPVPGRDIFVQAWYQGGISIIDFTDSKNPFEIAYFDRGPYFADEIITGGFWSVYWYEGFIYGTEIVRGLDVLSLLPSEHLTEHEIAAARLADQGALFNPQQQFRVSWPAAPAVALAYLDQLHRDNGLPEAMQAELREALDLADTAMNAGKTDKALARELSKMAKSVEAIKAPSDHADRVARLVETLSGIAKNLRS